MRKTSYVWTPSDFEFFFFFFLVSFCSSEVLRCRLDLAGVWTSAEESGHREPFLFQLRCSRATAWHPRPARFHPLQESRSCGAGRPAGRKRKVCFLTGLSPRHISIPRPQNKGLSGAGLALGRLRAGPPDNTKGGTFLGRLWGFGFPFFKRVGIPP